MSFVNSWSRSLVLILFSLFVLCCWFRVNLVFFLRLVIMIVVYCWRNLLILVCIVNWVKLFISVLVRLMSSVSNLSNVWKVVCFWLSRFGLGLRWCWNFMFRCVFRSNRYCNVWKVSNNGLLRSSGCCNFVSMYKVNWLRLGRFGMFWWWSGKFCNGWSVWFWFVDWLNVWSNLSRNFGILSSSSGSVLSSKLWVLSVCKDCRFVCRRCVSVRFRLIIICVRFRCCCVRFFSWRVRLGVWSECWLSDRNFIGNWISVMFSKVMLFGNWIWSSSVMLWNRCNCRWYCVIVRFLLCLVMFGWFIRVSLLFLCNVVSVCLKVRCSFLSWKNFWFMLGNCLNVCRCNGLFFMVVSWMIWWYVWLNCVGRLIVWNDNKCFIRNGNRFLINVLVWFDVWVNLISVWLSRSRYCLIWNDKVVNVLRRWRWWSRFCRLFVSCFSVNVWFVVLVLSNCVLVWWMVRFVWFVVVRSIFIIILSNCLLFLVNMMIRSRFVLSSFLSGCDRFWLVCVRVILVSGKDLIRVVRSSRNWLVNWLCLIGNWINGCCWKNCDFCSCLCSWSGWYNVWMIW